MGSEKAEGAGVSYIGVLAAMLAELALVAPGSPERQFLMERGWLPLGRAAFTGIEGWGKVIDGHAVSVDQPEALQMEGWKP